MPRAGLDLQRVLNAAASIADAEGLGALSISRLAQELRVKPPSLYNHVESLDAVRDGLMQRGLREMLEVSRDAIAGRSGREALDALAHAHRRYAKGHPGLYAAMQLPVMQGSEHSHALGTKYVDAVLAVLRGYGLEGDAALHATRCLRAALRGFIDLEVGGGFGLALQVDESFERLLHMLHDGLIEQARHPT
ncbi:WHG domain-containing protein (plasmid) [Deinococcus taeanensis]|uniref:TetR/AcrR family transcriptional regulator n=1 Tax=Deinococcus taeanensis TaxID=2737050 RepID=UPI001CDBA571|nr:TetR/AcrR family transcriptional regulator [Deinococcus taeanensis]UBV44538.1 WHG domain-containing protein [Deinococcus taeanensis]